MSALKACPRCRKATTLLNVYHVCTWCFDEVVHQGARERLKGYGYDLTPLAAKERA